MRDQSSMVFESPCTHWVSCTRAVKGNELEMDQVVWLFIFYLFIYFIFFLGQYSSRFIHSDARKDFCELCN